MGTMHGRTASVLIAALLAVGATTAAAEEVIGEVVATIDGEQHEWRALGPDGTGIEYNTSLQVFGPM